MIKILFICHGRNFRFSRIALFYTGFEMINRYFTTSLQLLKSVPILIYYFDRSTNIGRDIYVHRNTV